MFAIPPTRYKKDPYFTISSQVETTVTVHHDQESWEIYIPTGGATRHILSDSDRVVGGVEIKAFEITSEVPVTVYLGTLYHRSNRIPDDILMKPIHDDDTEFVITSYTGDEEKGEYRPGSFFMVIPKEHATFVIILKYENDMWMEQYSGTLYKYEVLTYDAYYSTNQNEDYTGWRILASHPIAVISGQGDGDFEQGNYSPYVCDSLPSKAVSGTEYITFPVVVGINATFYRLRIVSDEDDVTVTIPELGIGKRIPIGGFLEIDSDFLTSIMKVYDHPRPTCTDTDK